MKVEFLNEGFNRKLKFIGKIQGPKAAVSSTPSSSILRPDSNSSSSPKSAFMSFNQIFSNEKEDRRKKGKVRYFDISFRFFNSFRVLRKLLRKRMRTTTRWCSLRTTPTFLILSTSLRLCSHSTSQNFLAFEENFLGKISKG